MSAGPPLFRLALSLLFFGSSAPASAAPTELDAVNTSTMHPYQGEHAAGVDRTTLLGKVICGYQGWFNAASDGADRGYTHWTKDGGVPSAANVKIDLWPDVSELGAAERFPTDFKRADGSTAEVYSAYKQATVLRHFQWMKDYGIDGVFVQRFVTPLNDAKSLHHNNVVLDHCREGANRFGRTYAVTYDLSGMRADCMDQVEADWQALRTKMHITEDPAYLKHRGKPLVVVWGVGFRKDRDYTVAECGRLVKFLKKDGCTVMLGVPSGWRLLEKDSTDDPALHGVMKEADVVSPWTVGRYLSPAEVAVHGENYWKPDLVWCRAHGLDYLPVAFPGFSWFNMKGKAFNKAPRLKGEFLWSQFQIAKKSGAEMLYVAMFDEVDEGTAIFKCTNNVPAGTSAKFATYEDLPSDFYLNLTGEGARIMRGELPWGSPQPL